MARRKKRTSKRRVRRNVQYATANRRKRRSTRKRRRTTRNPKYVVANRKRSRNVRKNQLNVDMVSDVLVPVLGGTAGFLGARAIGNWAASQDLPLVAGSPNAGKMVAALAGIPVVAWGAARNPQGMLARNQGAIILGLGLAPVDGFLRGMTGEEEVVAEAELVEGPEEPTAAEQAAADEAVSEEAAKEPPPSESTATSGLGQFEWLRRLWEGRVRRRAKPKAKAKAAANGAPPRSPAERERVTNKAVRRAIGKIRGALHELEAAWPPPAAMPRGEDFVTGAPTPEEAGGPEGAPTLPGEAEATLPAEAGGGGAGAYYETEVRYPGTGSYYETGEGMGADYYTRGMSGSGDGLGMGFDISHAGAPYKQMLGLGADQPEAVSTVIPTDLALRAKTQKQWKKVRETMTSPGDRGYAGGLFSRHLFAGMVGQ